MNAHTIFAGDNADSPTNRLYRIISLAKVGAASSDTVLNLDHMGDAHRDLFEVIFLEAQNAVDLIETAHSTKEGTAL